MVLNISIPRFLEKCEASSSTSKQQEMAENDKQMCSPKLSNSKVILAVRKIKSVKCVNKLFM
jgi:hypothetical protein